jgi:hypothetical protein
MFVPQQLFSIKVPRGGKEEEVLTVGGGGGVGGVGGVGATYPHEGTLLSLTPPFCVPPYPFATMLHIFGLQH